MFGVESVVLLSSIIFVLIYFVKWKNNSVTLGRTTIDAVLVIYLLCLLNVTIFPIPFQKSFINDYLGTLGSNAHFTYNLIPFATIWNSLHNAITYNTYLLELKNIGGNLILLTPLGLYIHFIKRKLSFSNIMFIGFLVSIFIEILQLTISLSIGFSYRSFDVDDLLLNTLGFIYGYKSFLLIRNEFLKERTIHSNN
ncbi:VanZ family protein [Niallia sp. HCP3S3_B10]|uniref:VanZ family protein n=1 Tax=Niallia sp. HCP3S3_B10 TaxID=3438944 RepID=UPI003F8A485C